MKKIFIFINLIFIYLIIDFSVSGFYHFVEDSFEVNEFLKSPVTQSKSREKKNFHDKSYYKIVSKRDLFKTEKIIQPQKKKKPQKKKDSNTKKLEETRLKLDLLGTITGKGTEPYAVIQKKGDPRQMLYLEGDTVDRAVIKTILRKKVILMVEGKDQMLLMKEDSAGRQNNRSIASQNVSAGGQKNREAAVSTGFVDKISLTRDDIDELIANIGSLKKKIRIRPHFYKNKMDGFRVYGRSDNSFFQKVGVKNGDIISTVNSKKIRSVNDAVAFYKKFNSSEGKAVVDLGIKRRGKTGTIKYSIE